MDQPNELLFVEHWQFSANEGEPTVGEGRLTPPLNVTQL